MHPIATKICELQSKFFTPPSQRYAQEATKQCIKNNKRTLDIICQWEACRNKYLVDVSIEDINIAAEQIEDDDQFMKTLHMYGPVCKRVMDLAIMNKAAMKGHP